MLANIRSRVPIHKCETFLNEVGKKKQFFLLGETNSLANHVQPNKIEQQSQSPKSDQDVMPIQERGQQH